MRYQWHTPTPDPPSPVDTNILHVPFEAGEVVYTSPKLTPAQRERLDEFVEHLQCRGVRLKEGPIDAYVTKATMRQILDLVPSSWSWTRHPTVRIGFAPEGSYGLPNKASGLDKFGLWRCCGMGPKHPGCWSGPVYGVTDTPYRLVPLDFPRQVWYLKTPQEVSDYWLTPSIPGSANIRIPNHFDHIESLKKALAPAVGQAVQWAKQQRPTVGDPASRLGLEYMVLLELIGNPKGGLFDLQEGQKAVDQLERLTQAPLQDLLARYNLLDLPGLKASIDGLPPYFATLKQRATTYYNRLATWDRTSLPSQPDLFSRIVDTFPTYVDSLVRASTLPLDLDAPILQEFLEANQMAKAMGDTSFESDDLTALYRLSTVANSNYQAKMVDVRDKKVAIINQFDAFIADADNARRIVDSATNDPGLRLRLIDHKYGTPELQERQRTALRQLARRIVLGGPPPSLTDVGSLDLDEVPIQNVLVVERRKDYVDVNRFKSPMTPYQQLLTMLLAIPNTPWERKIRDMKTIRLPVECADRAQEVYDDLFWAMAYLQDPQKRSSEPNLVNPCDLRSLDELRRIFPLEDVKTAPEQGLVDFVSILNDGSIAFRRSNVSFPQSGGGLTLWMAEAEWVNLSHVVYETNVLYREWERRRDEYELLEPVFHDTATKPNDKARVPPNNVDFYNNGVSSIVKNIGTINDVIDRYILYPEADDYSDKIRGLVEVFYPLKPTNGNRSDEKLFTRLIQLALKPRYIGHKNDDNTGLRRVRERFDYQKAEDSRVMKEILDYFTRGGGGQQRPQVQKLEFLTERVAGAVMDV